MEIFLIPLEDRVGLDVDDDVEIAGRPPRMPASPLPLERKREASLIPAGMRSLMRVVSLARPSPRQEGQGSEMV